MNNYVDQFVNWVKSTFGYASTKNTASAHTRGKRIIIRQTPPNTEWLLAQPRNKKDQRLPTEIRKTNNQSPTAGLSDKLEKHMYAGMQSDRIGRNRGYDIRKLKGQPSYKI